MTGRWLKLVETHVEKGVLGLGALALLVMLFFYLIRSPNTVEYQNRKLGPRELLVAIKEDADNLQTRIGSAKMDDPNVEKFSEKLKQHHAAGIFATASEDEPALAPTLRRAAPYGSEIKVPGLEEAEDTSRSIVLVTPLRPSEPKLRTGRSLAVCEQVQITGLEQPPAEAPATEEAKATEVAWVTVAAYFNKKAQYTEMINAGYAPYRSKAYVVGMDVQRQEMLSTGEFSDWRDVEAGKAMPKFELDQPQFDDETGELLNKNDIRQLFSTIKYAQAELMQPPFYQVQDGDFWEVPPLPGHEDGDEEEEEEEEEPGPATGGRFGRAAPRAPAPPAPVQRRPTGGGRPASGGRMRGGGRPSGGGQYPGGGGQSEAEQKGEARKQLRSDLVEAKRLLGQKEYAQARDLAFGVSKAEHATAGQKRDAEKVIKVADRWLGRESERGRSGAGSGGRDMPDIVSNPETGEPAVWFHDDTVEAGKTYRYRMRVKLWNRYVGRVRSLKDPEQAKQPVVLGNWSYASEPITVTPSTYFFLSGSRPPDIASMEVWKWRAGRWLNERFDVSIGDIIGGVQTVRTGEYNEDGDEIRAPVDFTTGAVVLDLRFDEPVKDRSRGKDEIFSYRERISTVMTYLDPADGQVKERILLSDRRDPKKKELEEQAW
jgi:hypothetical protein